MWFFGRKNKKNKPTKSKFCVGLALSGGGTRGFAHLGVFKALQEHNVHVDCVAGTSAGALMGALYCAQIPWQKVVEQGKLVKKSDVLNKRLAIGSDAHNVGKLADRLLCGKTFEMLPIPFSAVSVDLATGNEIVLNTGSLADAISASAAVPVLFSPVKMGEMSLVDGGLLNNLPADVCRTMGAEVVIGVDLNHLRGSGTKSDKFFDTLLATWEITTKSSVYKGQMNSDVIIEPELSAYKNTSLSNIDEMVQAGYQATIEKMDEIKRLLQID